MNTKASITSVGTAAFELSEALNKFRFSKDPGGALDLVEKIESFINVKFVQLRKLENEKPGPARTPLYYDARCLDLAEYFLKDEPSCSLEPADLAADIQQLIEERIEEARHG